MNGDRDPLALPEQLAAAWPVAAWCDVHVLAAVSGGADSVALLRALVELKRRHGGAGRVIAAHVNHQLRGRGADEDEAWVRQQCAQLDVACVVRRAGEGAKPQAGGCRSEEAAREARYRLLVEMAEEAGARFVATGHTRDDQAETVLFRLVRGTGLRGLAGMRRVRPLSAGVTLVRPLLDSSRAELRAYLAALGQAWREDPTNEEVRFSRNRIRAGLLPLLREHFNAEADAAIVRSAELVGEAQEVIESFAGELLAQCGMVAGNGDVTLSVDPLAGRHALLTIEALRTAWRAGGFAEQAMTRAWWRKLAALATGEDAGAALNLPGNIVARREGDRMVLAGDARRERRG